MAIVAEVVLLSTHKKANNYSPFEASYLINLNYNIIETIMLKITVYLNTILKHCEK